MKKQIACILSLSAVVAFAEADPARWVDPFIGTDNGGNCFPGPSHPFGLMQPGPDSDTSPRRFNKPGGYVFREKCLQGFSQNHLNGPGCCDMGNLRLLPFEDGTITGSVHQATDWKPSERAECGYYSVEMRDLGVKAEVTAAAKAAMHRWTFRDGKARVLIDCRWGMGVSPKRILEHIREVDVRFDAAARRMTGGLHGWQWAPRQGYFALEFDRPWTNVEKLPPVAKEEAYRYVLSFDLKPGERLQAKVSLVPSDVPGAVKTLAKEIPDWDFEKVRRGCRAAWNEILGRTEVEGTEKQKRIWYTALYHLCLQPSEISDCDGRFRTFSRPGCSYKERDIQVAKRGTFYSTFSLWDTFRAAHPLYTILTPERVGPFIDALLEQDRRQGCLPVWPLWGSETWGMTGCHAVPVIVDAYLKGLRDFDVDYAYTAVTNTLKDGRYLSKKLFGGHWQLLEKYGYLPIEDVTHYAVSDQLEYSYDDICAARFAAALGHREDAAFFTRRSNAWTNVYDRTTKLFRGRRRDGTWREPFNEFAQGWYGAKDGVDYVEANAWQFQYHVLHDLDTLIALQGGREPFLKRLDDYFSDRAADVNGKRGRPLGAFGQYEHGNEPSHHVAYLPAMAGNPARTQELLRAIADRHYLDKPWGVPGNDDCGQTSAWYLFTAMGFYPVDPCGGEYVLGAPQLPRVELKLDSSSLESKFESGIANVHSRTRTPTRVSFTILARNLSKENKYVKSVTLNGKPVTDGKIRHADIVKGGELVFEMTDGPTAWRKLAYLHGVVPDASGDFRAEVNFSRDDIRNIAPLKVAWSAASGCAYTATFNGTAYPVAVRDGLCSFQVPNGAFKRDHNQVALGVSSGSDPALTNADRIAVFGSVESMKGPRLSRKDFFERHLDRRIPAFAEAARLSADGDEVGAVRTFAGYVRAHLDIPAATKEAYRNPDPAVRGRIRHIANRVLNGTMDEVGVLHTFAGGKIDWQFNPTWNGYREWVWHLSVLRFLDELVQQYVLDGNEAYAQAWARHFNGFVQDELCPVKAGGHETSSWRSLETASRLNQYLVNDVYWLLRSPVLTDDLIVTVFTSLWEHGNRLRTGHSTWGGNWFGNEMTSLYCFTLQVPYFVESEEWRAYALAKVEQELDQQVYPDGQQVELSTGYHPGMIGIFSRVPRMCAHVGVRPPAGVHAVLARMYEPYMAIMRPDRKIPALNDATIWASQKFFEKGLRDFPERTDFAWFAGRKGAEPPAWTSRALPYTGWVALRDSWKKDAVWGFMDCGPYGTGHQHEDKLNVLVCGYGRELVNEGGWYDYDTSENRKYILSTRSHNTVRFDGRDQATGSIYRWHAKTDSKRKADFLFSTNAAVDWAEATFAGPYRGNPGKGLTHRRRLMLFKKVEGLTPFLVVVDRFSCADAKSHAYEQLWHLRDAEFIDFKSNAFLADYGKGVRLAGAQSDAAAAFVDKRGQTEPELQGWDPGSWNKHNARPIATPVVCGSFTGSRRVVTVLQPLHKDVGTPRIVSVDASADSAADTFVLRLDDGRIVSLAEAPARGDI